MTYFEESKVLSKKQRQKAFPKTSMKSQGQRIEQLREALAWSNKKLSEQTGIPEPTLSMYVHARRESISAFELFRIADATGATTDWLIYGDRRNLPSDLKSKLPPETNGA